MDIYVECKKMTKSLRGDKIKSLFYAKSNIRRERGKVKEGAEVGGR